MHLDCVLKQRQAPLCADALCQALQYYLWVNDINDTFVLFSINFLKADRKNRHLFDKIYISAFLNKMFFLVNGSIGLQFCHMAQFIYETPPMTTVSRPCHEDIRRDFKVGQKEFRMVPKCHTSTLVQSFF